MKRFLLFRGNDYYPCGGWSDFDQSFDSPEAAIIYMQRLSEERGKDYFRHVDWWQVIDGTSGDVITYAGHTCTNYHGQFDLLITREVDGDY